MTQPQKLPTKHPRIDSCLLQPAHYTESLLFAAEACGLFSEITVSEIRGAMLNLLAERLRKLTDGKSCSVRAETAQKQLIELLYIFDMRLTEASDPDSAAELLWQASRTSDALSVLYQEGIDRIKRKHRVCQLQYQRLLPVFRQLPNSVFRITAIDGITGFFRLYQPEIAPTEIHITADYPLYKAESCDLQGISFLADYLDGMGMEAVFLSRFDRECQYRLLHIDRKLEQITPQNLFRPLFANALGMTVLQKPYSSWKNGLTQDEIRKLAACNNLAVLLISAVKQLAEMLLLPPRCAAYCQNAVPHLTQEIEAAMQYGIPSLIFPCADAPENPVTSTDNRR